MSFYGELGRVMECMYALVVCDTQTTYYGRLEFLYNFAFVTDVCKNGRQFGIANAMFSQGLLGVVHSLLHIYGIMAIRYIRRVKFCQRETIVGTLML